MLFSVVEVVEVVEQGIGLSGLSPWASSPMYLCLPLSGQYVWYRLSEEMVSHPDTHFRLSESGQWYAFSLLPPQFLIFLSL